MADFSAPSFSLGLDLDVDSNPQTDSREETLHKPATESSNNPSFQIFDEDSQPQTQDSDLRFGDNDDPPPILKRLRRGPPNRPSVIAERESVQLPVVDEDIEEFSSQEDRHRDGRSPIQNRSACTSSKLSLHCHRILSTQSTSTLKAQKNTPASNATTSRILEATSNKQTFPKLTISPIRKIQLLDSDSDDPSANENIHNDAKKIKTCARESHSALTQSVTGNQHKRAKISSNKIPTESLWKDFSPKKKINLATPALDEFCEEYFGSMKNKDVGKGKVENMSVSSSKSLVLDDLLDGTKSSFQKNSIHERAKHGGNLPNPLPPAYCYFYHDDPRIQQLVRDRLPNFSPLDSVNQRGHQQSEVTAIDYMSQFGHSEVHTQIRGTGNKYLGDYMSQFGHNEIHTQIQGTGNKGLGGSSKKDKRKPKSVKPKEDSQASGNWVDPRTSVTIPRNAGKRRVRADGQSAGHWFTGQDGRKVYVTKTGQELTGRTAYRHYKKETGARFRKPKKKAAIRKKSKR